MMKLLSPVAIESKAHRVGEAQSSNGQGKPPPPQSGYPRDDPDKKPGNPGFTDEEDWPEDDGDPPDNGPGRAPGVPQRCGIRFQFIRPGEAITICQLCNFSYLHDSCLSLESTSSCGCTERRCDFGICLQGPHQVGSEEPSPHECNSPKADLGQMAYANSAICGPLQPLNTSALLWMSERYKAWGKLPVDEKLAFEQKYVYGIRSLPPVENLLEGHMRYALSQAVPETMIEPPRGPAKDLFFRICAMWGVRFCDSAGRLNKKEYTTCRSRRCNPHSALQVQTPESVGRLPQQLGIEPLPQSADLTVH
eukprot:4463813-Amphidinium_carterae.1